MKKTKKNIINYYNKRKKNTFELELDDKVLISSNILIKRNKKDNLILIEKNKIKNEKALYNICGIIFKILNAGIYDVMISDDYKDFNLNKNDICRISSELFKVVPTPVWKKILGD